MNILFWNTSKNLTDNITNCLDEIIHEKDCDIVVLAEFDNDINNLCNMVNLLFETVINRFHILVGGAIG